MLIILLPVFLFTAAMAGGGAYFAGKFVLVEMPASRLWRAGFVALGIGLFFPPLYFGLYMLARPKDGASMDTAVTAGAAVIPSFWICLIMTGVAVGLWCAARAKIAALKRTPGAGNDQ